MEVETLILGSPRPRLAESPGAQPGRPQPSRSVQAAHDMGRKRRRSGARVPDGGTEGDDRQHEDGELDAETTQPDGMTVQALRPWAPAASDTATTACA